MLLALAAQTVIHLTRGTDRVEISIDLKQKHAVSAKLRGKVIWRAIPREWKPWKLALTDVDADGKQDFIVALRKVTRHAPMEIGNLYVYGFDGREIYPKWRGSRLGRDFVDFSVAKDKKGDKILTLDRLLDGRFTLSCYTWSGFGFRKRWEHGAWKQARLQEGAPNSITVLTENGPVHISTEGPR